MCISSSFLSLLSSGQPGGQNSISCTSAIPVRCLQPAASIEILVLMSNQIIELANRFYSDVINKGDLVAMNDTVSEDFTDHFAPPNSKPGLDGFKDFLGMVSAAFPDIRITVEDLIVGNNKVVARLTIEGTHTGNLMGNIPPTHKHATWTGIDILQITNGKITDRWSQRDLLSLIKQLGVIQ